MTPRVGLVFLEVVAPGETYAHHAVVSNPARLKTSCLSVYFRKVRGFTQTTRTNSALLVKAGMAVRMSAAVAHNVAKTHSEECARRSVLGWGKQGPQRAQRHKITEPACAHLHHFLTSNFMLEKLLKISAHTNTQEYASTLQLSQLSPCPPKPLPTAPP